MRVETTLVVGSSGATHRAPASSSSRRGVERGVRVERVDEFG